MLNLLRRAQRRGATAPPAARPSTAVRAELRVSGMRCAGCARSLSFTLSQVDGVYEVSADPATGRVLVDHDPARAGDGVLRATVKLCGLQVAE
jgi:copper chaperone CopZ